MMNSSQTAASARFDYLLVGGGLQTALFAVALAKRRPAARVGIVEQGTTLGGNHTWCFHDADLTPWMREATQPLIAWSWEDHEVRFPNRERVIAGAYHCVTSERLSSAVSTLVAEGNGRVLLGCTARGIEATHVELEDGTRLHGRVVIDARGPGKLTARWLAGYQKFLGLEVELRSASGLTRPLLMDARVTQLDGFRFVYVLPFGTHRLLIEDTYFSEFPELDVAALRQRVLDYARSHGLSVRCVLREETGVLPLPAELAPPSTQAPLVAGYQGGWFHPTTGYSFPIAARLAELLADAEPDMLYGERLELLSRQHALQARFALLLNRMLFDAFEPETRWNVFERFYGLPEATIQRFYALETTPLDRARILCGRPPRGLSLGRAVRRGIHP